MKRLILTAPLLGALLFSAAHAAAPAKAPAGLETMRKAFIAAIAAKDMNTAVKLSSFPLAISVYQQGPRMSEKDFRGSITSVGLDDAGIQHCVAHDALTFTSAKDALDKRYAGAWAADCDGNDYYFAQRKGAWLFIGYENINE